MTTTAEPTGRTVLTPTTEVATRAGARADALTPIQGVRLIRTAARQFKSPPDVWHDPRPSLQSMWLYARHGAWTGPEHWLARGLAGLYACGLALPLTAAAYFLLWLLERPGRAGIALVLFVLLRHALRATF